MVSIMPDRSRIVKSFRKPFPYPLKHVVPYARQRQYEGRKVTLCIAGVCDNGRHAVCIADGMLSDFVSGAAGDVDAIKITCVSDWIFMFAGHLSNADLIMEELRELTNGNRRAFSRASMPNYLRNAYKRHMAKWSADRNLAPYDLTMDAFKKNGRKMFGDERFGELSRAIEADANQSYNEQLLAVGWGRTEQAAAIFRIDRWGLSSHGLEGFAVIGSGGPSALSMLLTTGYSGHRHFEEALYLICAAKFASEGRDGVGRSTFLTVAHKRTAKDEKSNPPAQLVQPADIESLRTAWEKYGRPRIPVPALHVCDQIARKLELGTAGSATRSLQQAVRKR